MAGKVRIGLIGAGSVANWGHIPGFLADPRIEVTAVCDLVQEKAQAAADRVGGAQVYTEYRELLEKAPVDAVSVCTWNNSHAEISIAALEAGKQVLVEKPMAINAAQAVQMKATADRTGNLLMIGFCSRFGGDATALKRLIEAGDLGEIYYGKGGYLRRRGNPKGWFADKKRSGGGALIDIGVHVLDVVRWLMGNPKPIAVSGMTYNKLGDYQTLGVSSYDKSVASDVSAFDVDEMATALIRFEGGATMALEASWAMNIKNDHTYREVYGTKGGAKLNPLEIYTEVRQSLADIQIPCPTYTLHNAEIKHFVDCILNGEKCISPAEDGVEIMKIMDAIYRSTELGQEVRID